MLSVSGVQYMSSIRKEGEFSDEGEEGDEVDEE
jgi:hypothetical protein